jgi:hypothetical protein
MSFTLTATIAFTFLALVWKHNDVLNVFIKLGLVCLAFWGASIFFGV